LINGHNRGRYLDNKFFWPIFESLRFAPWHLLFA